MELAAEYIGREKNVTHHSDDGSRKEKQTLNNKKSMEEKQKEKFKFKETGRTAFVRQNTPWPELRCSLSLDSAQIVTDHRKRMRHGLEF